MGPHYTLDPIESFSDIPFRIIQKFEAREIALSESLKNPVYSPHIFFGGVFFIYRL